MIHKIIPMSSTIFVDRQMSAAEGVILSRQSRCVDSLQGLHNRRLGAVFCASEDANAGRCEVSQGKAAERLH